MGWIATGGWETSTGGLHSVLLRQPSIVWGDFIGSQERDQEPQVLHIPEFGEQLIF